MGPSRVTCCALLLAAGLARAEAPELPPDPGLPSRGTLLCEACAGVVLEKREVRGSPGRIPRCGVTRAAVELRGGAATLAAGVPVAFVPGSGGGWTWVRAASGERGYAPAGSVAPAETPSCRELPALPVKLRNVADAGAPVRAELPEGTPVAFGETSTPGWLRVLGPGGEAGFVPASGVLPESVTGRPGRGGFLALRAGLAAQTRDDLAEWGTSVPLEVALGLGISSHALAELSAGWQSVPARARGPVERELALQGTVRTFSLLAGVRLVVPAGPAEISAGLGAGLGFVSWKGDLLTSSGAAPVRGGDTGLLWRGGVGVAVPAGPGRRLGLDLRFVSGRAREGGVELSLDAVQAVVGLAWGD